MSKRGYSREFTPQTDRRVRFEVDRIPPTLYEAVKAKAKREGVSLRALTLRLWKDWLRVSPTPDRSAPPEHRCGLQGFNPMKDDTCPACDYFNAKARAAHPQPAAAPATIQCACDDRGDNPACPVDHDQISHQRGQPAAAPMHVERLIAQVLTEGDENALALKAAAPALAAPPEKA